MKFIPIPTDVCDRDDLTSQFFKADLRGLHEVMGWVLENLPEKKFDLWLDNYSNLGFAEFHTLDHRVMTAFRLRFADAWVRVVADD